MALAFAGLAVMVARLALRAYDLLLFFYFYLLATANLTLTAAWLAEPGAAIYVPLYFLLTFGCLILGGLIVAQVRIAFLIPMAFSCLGVPAVLILQNEQPSSAALLTGTMAALLLFYAGVAAVGSSKAESTFDQVKYKGLALFWALQAGLIVAQRIAGGQGILSREMVNLTSAVFGCASLIYLISGLNRAQGEASRQSGNNAKLYEGPAVLRPEIALARTGKDRWGAGDSHGEDD